MDTLDEIARLNQQATKPGSQLGISTIYPITQQMKYNFYNSKYHNH
jgi:hypothetical protein